VRVRRSGVSEELANEDGEMRVTLLVRLTARQKRRLMDLARKLRMSPHELVAKAIELAATFL
jgi:hypothetical protein